jgi:transposase-like protein
MTQGLAITLEEAEEFYLRQRLSLSKLARKKGVHPNQLRQDLIRFGIRIRPDRQPANAFDYDAAGNEML